MAYLHCHTKGCGWEQDDFWEDPKDTKNKYPYWPFRKDNINFWTECLFKDKIYFDKCYLEDMGLEDQIKEDDKGHYVDSRVYVASELRRKAKVIENMSVKTYEDWKKIKDAWICPKCGQRNWDID
ncbi:MAG: hypothetical protein PHW73_04155 [Atribacterota bacterium]|nr:hypothetical protein [Atribacterota bacterium]